MRPALVILFLSVASACTSPPGWEPGDPPMLVYAADDALWGAFVRGCAVWSEDIGLSCKRAVYAKDTWFRVDYLHGGSPDVVGRTTYECEFLGDDCVYQTRLRAEFLDDPSIAAHEIGHMITGKHDPNHVKHGPALMDASASSPTVTRSDLDYVWDAWR